MGLSTIHEAVEQRLHALQNRGFWERYLFWHTNYLRHQTTVFYRKTPNFVENSEDNILRLVTSDGRFVPGINTAGVF